MRAARRFIVGDEAASIARKFVGDPALVERALVTLATNRGLLLVGEPDTAKSLLSELIAAAVSSTSRLTVQGSAATTEDQIEYSWNCALLVPEGLSPTCSCPCRCCAAWPGADWSGSSRSPIARWRPRTRFCPCSPNG
ncbi:AAA family ATPase [Kitasatospora sp. NPDC059722]|uniref:AAA family ATPase n=1 Tax=Kitasatospora sp. NPDC059722 TaxID=3346925 RepID=UPI0036D1F637